MRTDFAKPRKAIFSTLVASGDPNWNEHVDALNCAGLPRRTVVKRILAAASRYEALILNGSIAGYSDVLSALLLAHRRRKPQVILADCTWKLGANPVDRLGCRWAIRSLDGPHAHYCVLSRAELVSFPHTWGVGDSRVHFTPWYHYAGSSSPPLGTAFPVDLPLVFAGGDSLRDYDPLLSIAGDLQARVVIATHLPFPKGKLPPANLTFGPVSPREYARLTHQADIVVVPLEQRLDRSAGQGTYLTAMAQGKVVVVTEAMGVCDYVEANRTALVVPPRDPEALLSTLRWALAPEQRPQLVTMCQQAASVVRGRFTEANYFGKLLKIAMGLTSPKSVTNGAA